MSHQDQLSITLQAKFPQYFVLRVQKLYMLLDYMYEKNKKPVNDKGNL